MKNFIKQKLVSLGVTYQQVERECVKRFKKVTATTETITKTNLYSNSEKYIINKKGNIYFESVECFYCHYCHLLIFTTLYS